jgi:hypothetical protein
VPSTKEREKRAGSRGGWGGGEILERVGGRRLGPNILRFCYTRDTVQHGWPCQLPRARPGGALANRRQWREKGKGKGRDFDAAPPWMEVCPCPLEIPPRTRLPLAVSWTLSQAG